MINSINRGYNQSNVCGAKDQPSILKFTKMWKKILRVDFLLKHIYNQATLSNMKKWNLLHRLCMYELISVLVIFSMMEQL